MPTSKIDIHSPVAFSHLTWTQQVGYWLGRLWRFCTSPFIEFIQRIVDVACARFSKDPEKTKQKSPISVTSEKTDSPVKVEEEVQDLEEDTEAPFSPLPSEEDSPLPIPQTPKGDSSPAPVVDSVPSPQSLPLEEQAVKTEKEDEEKKIMEEEKPSESSLPVEEKVVNPQLRMFSRFKRRRRPQNEEKDALDSMPAPTPPPKSEKPTAATPVAGIQRKPLPPKVRAPEMPKPIIIDNSGGGDCQLHAILKGLEMQYPSRLKYPEGGQLVTLTHEKLRQIGVDFAREQIDKYGDYVGEVLAYLDTDRIEYNEDQRRPIEDRMAAESKKIEANFKKKRISAKVYESSKKAHREKYAKLIDQFERTVYSPDDEDFLNRLEKQGFFCSTTHIFALSVKLELPIYVHEQAGVKNHTIQMFNPLESKEKPIHLYRVNNSHYKYILFPETDRSNKR